MNYDYKIGNKIVRVWSWDDDFHEEVTVHTSNGCFDRKIEIDNDGEKFFTWNKQRVYLKDYIKVRVADLKEKLENGESISPDELSQAILNDGVDNVRLICPLRRIYMMVPEMELALSYARETYPCICKITEDRYLVSKSYKIGVEPINSNYYASDEFYTSSLASLISSGDVEIMLASEVKDSEIKENKFKIILQKLKVK